MFIVKTVKRSNRDGEQREAVPVLMGMQFHHGASAGTVRARFLGTKHLPAGQAATLELWRFAHKRVINSLQALLWKCARGKVLRLTVRKREGRERALGTRTSMTIPQNLRR